MIEKVFMTLAEKVFEYTKDDIEGEFLGEGSKSVAIGKGE